MLCEPEGGVTKADGVLNDVFKLVFCVARAELARVGMHREGHDSLEI